MTDRSTRNAVRLIIVSHDHAVLLLRYERDEGSGSTFWVPPGGALERGESHRDAARRELMEETGIDADIGKDLWDLEFEYDLNGQRIRQCEKYVSVRVGTAEHDLRNSSSEPILEHRWWSLEDLAKTEETIYPEGLINRLRTVITDPI